jgi:hypothetical protein
VPQAPSPGRTSEFGSMSLGDPSYAEIHRRAQARRAAYLTALRCMVASLQARRNRTPAATPSGMAGERPASRATAWQRPELFGCVALAGLALAIIGWPSFNAGTRPCWTEPGVLAPEASLDVRMMVVHNSACSVWSKVETVSIHGVGIAASPQHGALALRGRSGVTYRPARGFTGRDSFAFSMGGTSPVRDEASLVHVDVTVRLGERPLHLPDDQPAEPGLGDRAGL